MHSSWGTWLNPLEQLSTAQRPLCLSDMLGEIVGEGAIVGPFDIRIGRGLIVFAPAEKHMV